MKARVALFCGRMLALAWFAYGTAMAASMVLRDIEKLDSNFTLALCIGWFASGWLIKLFVERHLHLVEPFITAPAERPAARSNS